MNTTRKLLTFIENYFLDGSYSKQEAIQLLLELHETNFYSCKERRINLLKALVDFDVRDLIKTKCTIPREKYFEILFSMAYPDKDEIRRKCYGEKDEVAKKQKQYPYIPLSPYSFNRMLEILEKKYGKRKSFIDVGCGIGDKTLFALLSGLFDNCYGIEYDKTSYDIAYIRTRSLMLSHLEILDYKEQDKFNPFIHEDAFKHSFAPYDTVYLYCPLSIDEQMSELLSHIYNTVKPGAIICFNNANLDVDKWQKKHKIKSIYKDGAYFIEKK